MKYNVYPPRPQRDLSRVPEDFWDQNRLQSGRQLDSILGQNIPFNSKTIDRTDGLHSYVSHKSTDLRRKTYRSLARIRYIGKHFVRVLSAYKGEVRQDHKLKATFYLMVAPFVDAGAEPIKILEWYLPKSGVTKEQITAVEEVAAYGARWGIDVRVFRI